jgi:protein-tyrosine-phosphatase
MSSTKSVLFVCAGNTCRSPVCAGVCKKLCPLLCVGSAGVRCSPGGGANALSIAVCQENGIDITSHERRCFEIEDWNRWSVLAAVDPGIYSWIEQTEPAQITAKLVLFAGPDGVDDPFGGTLETYRAMFRTVQGAMESFLKQNDLS